VVPTCGIGGNPGDLDPGILGAENPASGGPSSRHGLETRNYLSLFGGPRVRGWLEGIMIQPERETPSADGIWKSQ